MFETVGMTEMVEKIIGIRGFTLEAKRRKILDSLNLDIYSNQINTIVGPSGSGKSSLIRSINRITDMNPDYRASGTIVFNGKDVTEYDPIELRKKIGMVFQKPNPFPMSIYDNVAFGPRLHYKLSKKELDKVVEDSLKEAGLYDEVKDDLQRQATSLSGGQQQRLCIARAIAVKPDVIMMDEPTSSLDPIAKGRVENLMVSLKQKYTVVLVTHDIRQAARVSDYASFLYEGRILEYGEKSYIFENPENEITKEFLKEELQ